MADVALTAWSEGCDPSGGGATVCQVPSQPGGTVADEAALDGTAPIVGRHHPSAQSATSQRETFIAPPPTRTERASKASGDEAVKGLDLEQPEEHAGQAPLPALDR
jgi:hypothetical protein